MSLMYAARPPPKKTDLMSGGTLSNGFLHGVCDPYDIIIGTQTKQSMSG